MPSRHFAARYALGIIYRHFHKNSAPLPHYLATLYKILVRPILEYAAVTWDSLESNQHLALKQPQSHSPLTTPPSFYPSTTNPSPQIKKAQKYMYFY